jgi:hypothetical protein
MSSSHFGYVSDAFEFGFDDERRETRKLVPGLSNFISKESRESHVQVPRTMQKTVPLMDFQRRAAKRIRFPDVSEKTEVAIFRMNKDAGIIVGLASCMEVLAGSVWEYEVSTG